MNRVRTLTGLAALAALTACGSPTNGTPKATMLSPEGADHVDAAFSPDGKRVAFWDARPANNNYLEVAAASEVGGARILDSATSQISTPLWSPDGSTLAYSAGPNLDIWVVPVASGSARRLTTSKGLEAPVQWYPKGGRLTYIATGKAGTARAGQIDVTTGTTSPILAESRLAIPFWSPDGTKVAYMLIDAGKTTIWVADSAGRNGRQLTTEGFEDFSDYAGDPWSPDGSELLYQSKRTGFGDIWVVSVATDSMRQLTRDVRDDRDPSWSPDGRWVAFVSDRGRQTDVWIVPAAGGVPQRVTDDAAVEGSVQWVPGTNEIGFTTGSTERGLWAMTLADTSERRVTPDSIQMGLYDLSPDGKMIVFMNNKSGGVIDLDIMPVSGGAPRTLVSNGAANMSPEWSPDGSKVLYVSTKTGSRDVWVVDTAGGAPKDLTPWPTNETVATWAKDGASVYFESTREAKPVLDLWEVGADGSAPRRLTHTGNIQGVMVSRASGDVFVLAFGGSEGQVVLSRLLPNGSLATLWDQSNVVGVIDRYIMPSGDSIAFFVPGPSGARQQMLMSTRGGAARPLLPANEGISGWSPDGTHAVAFTDAGSLFLFSRTDSTQRPLVKKSDGYVNFLPDGKSFLYVRSTTVNRIATVDVSGLMAKEK